MTIAYEPQFGTVVSPRQFSPRRSGAATRGNVSVVLTARGRFVLAIVIAALVLAAVVLLGATVAASKIPCGQSQAKQTPLVIFARRYRRLCASTL